MAKLEDYLKIEKIGASVLQKQIPCIFYRIPTKLIQKLNLKNFPRRGYVWCGVQGQVQEDRGDRGDEEDQAGVGGGGGEGGVGGADNHDEL